MDVVIIVGICAYSAVIGAGYMNDRIKQRLEQHHLAEQAGTVEIKELRKNVAHLIAQNQELLKSQMRRQMQARQALQVAKSRPTRNMAHLIRRSLRAGKL